MDDKSPKSMSMIFFFYAGIVYREEALFFASQMVREREVKALQDISQRHV